LLSRNDNRGSCNGVARDEGGQAPPAITKAAKAPPSEPPARRAGRPRKVVPYRLGFRGQSI
jgi:hypothetical protein